MDELKTLYAIKDRLNKRIEAALKNLPEKQELDAVTLLIERAEKLDKPSGQQSELDVIMNGVVTFFKKNGNKPSTIEEIVSDLERQGISIGSSRPGASVAAMMTRSAKWGTRFQCANRIWKLSE